MKINQIAKIFEDTAYVRMGGTEEELRCAEYLVERCAEFGGKPIIEEFPIDMAKIQEATL